MKKHLLILILSACTNLLQAVPGGDSTQFKRWSLGISLSPDYCFKSPGDHGQHMLVPQGYVYSNVSESSKMGFTTGLNVNYFLKRKIALCIGLQYANKGYSAKADLPAWTAPYLNDPSIPNYNDFYSPASSNTYHYNYHYLDIPVGAVFLLGNKKLQGLLSAGAAANFLLKETVKADHTFSDGTKTHDSYQVSRNDRFNVSPFASAGISYSLTPKVRLRAEAIGRCGIIQVRDYRVYGSLISTGINFSCFVSL